MSNKSRNSLPFQVFMNLKVWSRQSQNLVWFVLHNEWHNFKALQLTNDPGANSSCCQLLIECSSQDILVEFPTSVWICFLEQAIKCTCMYEKHHWYSGRSSTHIFSPSQHLPKSCSSDVFRVLSFFQIAFFSIQLALSSALRHKLTALAFYCSMSWWMCLGLLIIRCFQKNSL